MPSVKRKRNTLECRVLRENNKMWKRQEGKFYSQERKFFPSCMNWWPSNTNNSIKSFSKWLIDERRRIASKCLEFFLFQAQEQHKEISENVNGRWIGRNPWKPIKTMYIPSLLIQCYSLSCVVNVDDTLNWFLDDKFTLHFLFAFPTCRDWCWFYWFRIATFVCLEWNLNV